MKRIIYCILLFIVWLLLTWSLDVQNVVVGLIVSILCTVLIGHLFFDNTVNMFDPRRIFWFIYYLPVLAIHIITANLDVMYRVLHKDMPIHPGIVRVKTTLKSDLGLTFLANSITLTPGTLTIDIIGSDMYIHWINVQSDDPVRRTEIIVSRFENILKKVFE